MTHRRNELKRAEEPPTDEHSLDYLPPIPLGNLSQVLSEGWQEAHKDDTDAGSAATDADDDVPSDASAFSKTTGGDGGKSAKSKRQRKTCQEKCAVRHKRAVIVISAMVVIALGVTGIYWWNMRESVRASMESCTQSRKLYDDALEDFGAAHDSASEMQKIKESQVTDSSTVQELASILNRTTTTPMDCTAESGPKSVEATAEELDRATLELERQMKDLSRAVRLVETSREEKIFRESVTHAENLVTKLKASGISNSALVALENEVAADKSLLESEETKDFVVLQSAEESLEATMDEVTHSFNIE